MAKLKDQCDAIKTAITLMEPDVSECLFLDKSKKDLAYLVNNNAQKRTCDKSKKNIELLEEQYLALADKKRSLSHSFVYLIKYRIFYTQLFLQFSFMFLLSIGCGVMFVNIRYFTEIMITVIVIMMSLEHLIY